MLIDKFLPKYHFSEKHTIEAASTKELIIDVILELCPNEISFLFKLLFFIRTIPQKIFGTNNFDFSPNTSLIMQLEEIGFHILEKNNDEIVIGIINQGNKILKIPLFHENGFINFKEKKSKKIALNFFLSEHNDKVIIQTETRIYASDKNTRMKFAMYWLFAYSGSALIRKVWLKAIKKKSEKCLDEMHK